jgi:hypothetical protein
MQYFSAFPVPATAGFPLEFYGPNSGQCVSFSVNNKSWEDIY